MAVDLSQIGLQLLFAHYCAVLDELRSRGIARSTNNPVADYSELLCEHAFKLQRAPKSCKGYDGIDPSGKRVQVKGRRVTAHNPSRQLSFIRDLDCEPFDTLAGVLFREDFSVWKAALVPISVVKARAAYVKHTSAWRLVLVDATWAVPGVTDATEQLCAAEKWIGSPGSDR